MTLAVTDRNDSGSFSEGLLVGGATVLIETPRSFFESSEHRADGLVWSAESGSAWTLLYPDYSVVPLRPLFQVPLGYPVAPRDGDFAELLSGWLELTAATSLQRQLNDHWFLGRTTESVKPRWSVIRDVLGWVEGLSKPIPSRMR